MVEATRCFVRSMGSIPRPACPGTLTHDASTLCDPNGRRCFSSHDADRWSDLRARLWTGTLSEENRSCRIDQEILLSPESSYLVAPSIRHHIVLPVKMGSGMEPTWFMKQHVHYRCEKQVPRHGQIIVVHHGQGTMALLRSIRLPHLLQVQAGRPCGIRRFSLDDRVADDD